MKVTYYNVFTFPNKIKLIPKYIYCKPSVNIARRYIYIQFSNPIDCAKFK